MRCSREWPRRFQKCLEIFGASWWRWNWNGLSGRRPPFCTRSIIVKGRSPSATVSLVTIPTWLLWRHAVAKSGLARNGLGRSVANWKSRFFAASWARYDLAKPGTFRLAPPEFRLAELKKDYLVMGDMFLTAPPSFESVIKTVFELEREINGRQPA